MAINWVTFLIVTVNTVASVSIVSVNKHVVSRFLFPCTLALMHFVSTYLGLLIAWKCLRAFSPARKLRKAIYLPITLAFIGYVVLNNISIGLNNLAFYQATKVLCTPITAAFETVLMRKRFGLLVWVSLFTVVLGVSIVSYSTFEEIIHIIVSGHGTLGMLRPLFIGIITSFVTSFNNVWTRVASVKLKCSTAQILFAQLPFSIAAITIIMLQTELPAVDAVFFEELQHNYFIYASCFLAFLVNLTQFMIVGKLSPTTSSILAHFKTFANFGISIFVLREPLDFRKLSGIIILAIGMVMYSWLLNPSHKISTDEGLLRRKLKD